MIERTTDIQKFKKLLSTNSIVVLTGPRGIGKTTFAKQLNPDYFFNLESPHEYDEFKEILHTLKGVVVIDEASNKPDVFSLVKQIVDDRKDIKFVIISASMTNLSMNLGNTLIGRAAFYELNGLKLSDIKFDIENQILKGSFPNSFYSDDETSFKFRTDYLTTSINLNLQKLGLNLSPHLVQKFLSELAFSSGKILNKSHLANLLSISRSTVENYLNFFEQSFLIRLIPNISNNITSKIIFRDSGILNNLLNNQTSEQLNTSTYFYQIWESYTIETIINEFSVQNPLFYTDKSGTEIDLVADIKQFKFGFIFSNSGTFKAKEKISDLIVGLRLQKLFVINNINRFEKINNNIFITPLEKLKACITGNELPEAFSEKGKYLSSPKPKVFISYSHKDSDFVLELKQKLEKKDVEIHIDIEKLKYGDNIKDFISKTVRTTDYTIQVISINSLRSPYVMVEYLETQLYQTVEGEKKYVPIFIDLSIFEDNTYIDLADDIQNEINGVNDYISKAITRNLQITPYNTKRERLIDLLNNLGKAINILRESLIGDFTKKEKIDINIEQIIEAMK
ncbi:MAG: TIR domain-containing protein [Prolixibacteraceae bacterium]|nr:TIR domain-containing protein [Prolixibacteraceae bacterium]